MEKPLRGESDLAIPLGRRHRVGRRLVGVRRLRDDAAVLDVDDDDDDQLQMNSGQRFRLRRHSEPFFCGVTHIYRLVQVVVCYGGHDGGHP